MISDNPSGVVSFLFTDIVGSTRSWESDRKGMAKSLRVHDELIRRHIASNSGYVFSADGDGFAAAFALPDDALTAALAIQMEVGSTTWPGTSISVRTAIHTGSAEEREGDYFGPSLNRTARLNSAGHGGQVLVSHVSAELLDGSLPEGCGLADLGIHQLRDVELPQQIFELRHPDLTVVHDPIRTFEAPRNNLPRIQSTFIGRDKELAAISEALSRSSLVTLAGPGGTGKSRLAVEYGRQIVDEYDDGVWLIELAPVVDPDLVLTSIAEALRIRPGEGVSTRAAVEAHFTNHRLLLIIDNCEHLRDAVEELTTGLLSHDTESTILATSQASIGMPGETVIRIPALGLPTEADPASSEAVQLFLNRAEAVRPGFEATPEEMTSIAQLCNRVDGIPLGIELAAARLRSLSPRELVDRLADSFEILHSRSIDGDVRHETLAATIGWSYDLLTPEEQAVCKRLSIFAGGFGLEAAEAVCGVDSMDLFDRVDSLADKSLVTVIHGGYHTRYRMLEPVRDFARSRLVEANEHTDVRLSHAEYFADLARTAEPYIRSPKQREWDERLLTESSNLWTALHTFMDLGAIEAYLEVCFDLMVHWQHQMLHVDAMEAILAGLDAGKAIDSAIETKACCAAVLLGTDVMHPRSIEVAKRGLAVAEAVGDNSLRGRMMIVLGSALSHDTGLTDFVGLDLTREGAALYTNQPEPYWWDREWDTAFWKSYTGLYLGPEGDDDLVAGIEASRATGDAAVTARALLMGGVRGATDDPKGLMTEAVDLARAWDLRWTLGMGLYYLGAIERMDGEVEAANRKLTEAIPLLKSSGGDMSADWALNLLAITEASLGDVSSAKANLATFVRTDAVRNGLATASAAIISSIAGATHEAALFLGSAEKHLRSNFLTDRDLEEVNRSLATMLPDAELDSLKDEGAAMKLNDMHSTILAWATA